MYVHLQLLVKTGLLSEEDKKNIAEEKSTKTFRFGGGEVRSSIKCVTLPAEVAGAKGTITIDVVNADLFLLSGMQVLKRAKLVINFDTDEAMIFGMKLNLAKLSAGHYILPLRPNYQKVEPDVCLTLRYQGFLNYIGYQGGSGRPPPPAIS